jgi:hypothetical protein
MPMQQTPHATMMDGTQMDGRKRLMARLDGTSAAT